jgi:hypothetical protein
VLTFVGLIGYANWEEKRVPDIEDVEYARVNMNLSMDYVGEDIQTVIDLHKMILEDVDYYEYVNNTTSMFDDRKYVYITYYLENGTQSLKNTFNATSNAEGHLTFVTDSNKTTREIIIEDNIGVSVENKTYKRSFIVKESDIAPLVNSLEILSIGNGCYLDGITVIDDDVINIKVILDSSALFGQGSLMGAFARFDVIPQMIAVSMPVSLGETVVSGMFTVASVSSTVSGEEVVSSTE